MSQVPAEKINAYRDTHYRVGNGDGAFTLLIGERSEALARLYTVTGESCGIFITAYNPFGQQQDDKANAAAHRRLGDHLHATTPHVVEGVGKAAEGNWPEEKSFLALGIDLETARRLGWQAHQDAVVWVGEDAIPRLIVLR